MKNKYEAFRLITTSYQEYQLRIDESRKLIKIMRLGFSICSYNRPYELKRCIDSLLFTTQHLKNTYYLLVDNCSPQISKSQLENYRNTALSNLNIVRFASNKGITGAFNFSCYSLSKNNCDIFFIINDDIFFKKRGWVEGYLLAHKQSGIHHFNFMDGRNIVGRQSFGSVEVTYHNWVRGCLEVITKECYKQVGGYRKCFHDFGCMDTDLSDRIILNGFASSYLQELYSYCTTSSYKGHYNMGFSADIEQARNYIFDPHPNMGVGNPKSQYSKKKEGFEILSFEREKRTNHLLVLTYHHILNAKNSKGFPKDFGVTTVESFKSQIHTLIKMGYHFFSPSQLNTQRPLPSKICILSFDDGYHSIYQNAYPILKNEGISAIYFLTTGFLDQQELFPYHEFLWFLESCKDRSIKLSLLPSQCNQLTERELRLKLKWFFRFSANKQQQKEMIHFLKGTFENNSYPERFYLTWGLASKMSDVFEYGAHTVTHPQLSLINSTDMKKEIYKSKQELQKRLGGGNWFAYPYGYSSSFNQTSINFVRESGFLGAFTTEPKKNTLPIKEPFLIGRFSPENLAGEDFKKRVKELR